MPTRYRIFRSPNPKAFAPREYLKTGELSDPDNGVNFLDLHYEVCPHVLQAEKGGLHDGDILYVHDYFVLYSEGVFLTLEATDPRCQGLYSKAARAEQTLLCSCGRRKSWHLSHGGAGNCDGLFGVPRRRVEDFHRHRSLDGLNVVPFTGRKEE